MISVNNYVQKLDRYFSRSGHVSMWEKFRCNMYSISIGFFVHGFQFKIGVQLKGYLYRLDTKRSVHHCSAAYLSDEVRQI